MSPILEQYQQLVVELLGARAAAGGKLPQETESTYVGRLDVLWWQLSDEEQEQCEQLLRDTAEWFAGARPTKLADIDREWFAAELEKLGGKRFSDLALKMLHFACTGECDGSPAAVDSEFLELCCVTSVPIPSKTWDALVALDLALRAKFEES